MAKIAGVGMALEDVQEHHDEGTDWFEHMSPEATGHWQTLRHDVSSASDVFSFGLVLWEMLVGMRVRRGFPDRYHAAIEERVQSIALWMLDGSRPHIPDTVALPLHMLLKALWAPLPADRIRFDVAVPALHAICLAQERGRLDRDKAQYMYDEADPCGALVEWIRENVGEAEAKSVQLQAQARPAQGKLWTQIDKDGSGTLDKDEVVEVMKQMGKQVSGTEVDAMMAEMDEDGSGEVDFEEFVERWQEPEPEPKGEDGSPLQGQAQKKK